MPTEAEIPQKLTKKKTVEAEVCDLLNRLNLEKGQIGAPPRKIAGTSGKPSTVHTNIYQLKTDGRYVYRYDLKLTGKTKSGNEVDLSKRNNNGAVVADRISNCRDAFRSIIKANPKFFGDDVSKLYYDFQSILYTQEPLALEPNATKQFIVEGEDAKLQTIVLDSITMEIKNVNEKAQKIKLDDLSKLINAETLSSDRSLLNFIELAVKQFPMMNERLFVTLRDAGIYFYDGKKHGFEEKELDETKYLAAGVQTNAMLIEGFKNADSTLDQRCVGLLVKPVWSPFYKSMRLLQYINLHYGPTSLVNELIFGKFEESKDPNNGLNQLTSTFKGMQFFVVYPNNKVRKIILKSFDVSTANNHIIPNLDISIADYYFDKYGNKLKYPDAHLVAVKQGNQMNYYPPEYLWLDNNQTVSTEKMDAATKRTLVNETAIRPDILKDNKDKIVEEICLHSNQYTESAGIKFSKKALEVKNRILDPPIIKYGNDIQFRVGIYKADWAMYPFIQPATCNNFAVYLLDAGNLQMKLQEVDKFQAKIGDFSRKLGMDLGECKICETCNVSQIEECVKHCSNNDISLCLFITPDNVRTLHKVMKSCEHKYNVVTQDLMVKTAKKMLKDQDNGSTIKNYLAKTNIKLGGLNHTVEVTDPEIMEELKNSLFVGISLNQPVSKTIVDRASSISNEKPGVLGYSANTGANYNQFIGDFYYTPGYRNEIYAELQDIFKICVRRFKKNRNNCAPRHVFFYYNGLAEGQFLNAQRYSIPLIKNGIRMENNGIDIPLTLISVQKSNIVLFLNKFPQIDKDHLFNVPHGTVVDTTIVHPVFPEFVLLSHSTKNGTAQFPKYTVLYDERNLSLDLLEGLTHVLCYEHQIVSSAISSPTPVYVADHYATRGRDVFNSEYNDKTKKRDLPVTDEGKLDLGALSESLNYLRTSLANQRVNA